MFDVPEHIKEEAVKKIWEKLYPYLDKEKTAQASAELPNVFDEVVDIVKKGFGF